MSHLQRLRFKSWAGFKLYEPRDDDRPRLLPSILLGKPPPAVGHVNSCTVSRGGMKCTHAVVCTNSSWLLSLQAAFKCSECCSMGSPAHALEEFNRLQSSDLLRTAVGLSECQRNASSTFGMRVSGGLGNRKDGRKARLSKSFHGVSKQFKQHGFRW